MIKRILTLSVLWLAIACLTAIPAGLAWLDGRPYEAMGIVGLMALILAGKCGEKP